MNYLNGLNKNSLTGLQTVNSDYVNNNKNIVTYDISGFSLNGVPVSYFTNSISTENAYLNTLSDLIYNNTKTLNAEILTLSALVNSQAGSGGYFTMQFEYNANYTFAAYFSSGGSTQNFFGFHVPSACTLIGYYLTAYSNTTAAGGGLTIYKSAVAVSSLTITSGALAWKVNCNVACVADDYFMPKFTGNVTGVNGGGWRCTLYFQCNGVTGPAPTVLIGSVNTISGATPTINITGVNPYYLNFGIPILSLGTVTNLAAGSTGFVTISNYIINFGIVKGDKGDTGASITGPAGRDGADGKDSTVAGPPGPRGSDGTSYTGDFLGSLNAVLGITTLALLGVTYASTAAFMSALATEIAVLDEQVSVLDTKTLYLSTGVYVDASIFSRFTSNLRINNGVSDNIVLYQNGDINMTGTLTTGTVTANNYGTVNGNNATFTNDVSCNRLFVNNIYFMSPTSAIYNIATVNDLILYMETTFSTLSGQVAAESTYMSTVSSYIIGNNTNITNINNNVTSLLSSVALLNAFSNLTTSEVTTISSSLVVVYNEINSLSGLVLYQNNWLNTLSNNIYVIGNEIVTLSSQIYGINYNMLSISGYYYNYLVSLSGNLNTIINMEATNSGTILYYNNYMTSLSGGLFATNNNINVNLAIIYNDIYTISGYYNSIITNNLNLVSISNYFYNYVVTLSSGLFATNNNFPIIYSDIYTISGYYNLIQSTNNNIGIIYSDIYTISGYYDMIQNTNSTLYGLSGVVNSISSLISTKISNGSAGINNSNNFFATGNILI